MLCVCLRGLVCDDDCTTLYLFFVFIISILRMLGAVCLDTQLCTNNAIDNLIIHCPFSFTLITNVLLCSPPQLEIKRKMRLIFRNVLFKFENLTETNSNLKTTSKFSSPTGRGAQFQQSLLFAAQVSDNTNHRSHQHHGSNLLHRSAQ
jgi:hypothetical protein